jgi:hypothetical protein
MSPCVDEVARLADHLRCWKGASRQWRVTETLVRLDRPSRISTMRAR